MQSVPVIYRAHIRIPRGSFRTIRIPPALSLDFISPSLQGLSETPIRSDRALGGAKRVHHDDSLSWSATALIWRVAVRAA